MTSRPARYLLPAAVAAALAYSLSDAQERRAENFQVSRLGSADGTGGEIADLGGIEIGYDRMRELVRKRASGILRRTQELKDSGHHAGLPACRSEGERAFRLKETVPPRFRAMTLYFVRIPKGGLRPRILPEKLPAEAEVFVLEASSLSDVATLSRILARRVSLASREFAQAMGASCLDAQVRFSPDGTVATVREVSP